MTKNSYAEFKSRKLQVPAAAKNILLGLKACRTISPNLQLNTALVCGGRMTREVETHIIRKNKKKKSVKTINDNKHIHQGG